MEKFAIFTKNIIDWFKSDLCFFKYFFEAFKITNNNIILTTPLIFFVMFMNFYMVFSPSSQFNIAFILFMFIALTAAFFSGWFYTIKLAVDNNKQDSLNLIKLFPTGVGLFFIDYFFMTILFFIMLILIILFTYKSAYAIIGDIGITRPELFAALSSPDATLNLISQLSIEQQKKLGYWNLYFMLTTTLYSFMLMLWVPQIIYKKDSVLNAFINSIANLFRRFFKSLTIFSYLMLIYFVISLFSILINIKIVQILLTIVYFYFLVYAAILIFLFYKREFCQNE